MHSVWQPWPNLKDLVDVFDLVIPNVSCAHDELLQVLAAVLDEQPGAERKGLLKEPFLG